MMQIAEWKCELKQPIDLLITTLKTIVKILEFFSQLPH